MNIQKLASEFWQQGFLVIDNFFDNELMDNCQQHIMTHFGEDPDFVHNEEFLKKSATDVIPWFPQEQGIDDFDIPNNDQRLKALTQAILGENWSNLYAMVMFSKRGSKGQAWHQDSPPEDKSKFNLNRLVYSMDINEHIGGQTLVMPATHLEGAITVGDINQDFANQVVLSPKKGTLVLLHGHTWHRVLNIKGKYRVSTNYRCCPAGTPSDITDIAVYRNMRYQFSSGTVIEDRLKQHE
jgi:ectoine hydroxylase